ncbi:MAG: ribonuclease R [Patescibacteria group bacterium]|nr:ribonuclease R [bacterium]MDZ4240590.1 ribonuclease R [Patescibacteria group bacterium]
MKHKSGKSETEARIVGQISINSKGVGFVSFPGLSEDVEIPESSLKTALNKDTVEVLLHPAFAKKRRSGEVIKIVARAKTRFVGIVKKQNDLWILVPDDRRVYRDIIISEKDSPLTEGVKVVVEMTEWRHHKENPQGKVVAVLGAPGEHNVEMESIVLEKGFDLRFPKEVEEAAEQVKKDTYPIRPEELAKRRDIREITTFTIDPADAKDFDDALSFRTIGDNLYEIGVHIADVSHYVTEGSAIDKEAKKRGTSIYLVDRTVPMLPPVLSNDLCSLNPNEDKCSFSAIFEMTGEGKVQKRWFGKTVMNSDKRFDYEEAQGIIEKGGIFENELRTLNAIAKKLTEKRFREGSIDFETVEVKFKLDENGVPLSVYKKPRLDTNRLIEEFMLLANREVAEFMYRAQKSQGNKIGSFIFRIHDVPDKERIESLAVFARALGYVLPIKNGKVTSKDMNALLKKIEGKTEESLISTAAVRSMAKAVYSTKNIGHFGLAFNYYTHFTSPIRRYPDLIVHRLLEQYLQNKAIPLNEYAKYEKIAEEASAREKSAAEAERDSVKYKQVEYMTKFVGKDFKGIISGVTEWGIYIEEMETRSEGMAKLRDMNDDFYTLDEKTYSLVGRRTGKRFSLGEEVSFRVAGTDLEKKTIDYRLL